VAASQDSSHPTGVTQTRKGRTRPGEPVGDYAYIQRNRKADAALSLRLSGASWSDIAITLGFPTPRAALVATERALVKQLSETDREKMRMLAGARLERLMRSVWAKAIDPDSPDQMTAVNRARELIDRHAKLFGLDAPTEIVVHSPTQSELEDWVLRMTATMVPEVEEPDIFESEPPAIESGLAG
jgi:hypothetical protein